MDERVRAAPEAQDENGGLRALRHPRSQAVEKYLKKARFNPARLDHHPVCGWVRGEDIRTHLYQETIRVNQ